MSERKQLPQYKCHKVVGALKIRNVEIGLGDWVEIYFEEDGYASVRESKTWHGKHQPTAGDYYVQYADGYTSVSPTDAFESGYTRMPDPSPIQALLPRKAQVDITRYVGQLSPEADATIDDMFDYHRWDADQIALGGLVRKALAEAFKTIVVNVPPSPDRSAALRKIRDARMDSNSAITHRGRY